MYVSSMLTDPDAALGQWVLAHGGAIAVIKDYTVPLTLSRISGERLHFYNHGLKNWMYILFELEWSG